MSKVSEHCSAVHWNNGDNVKWRINPKLIFILKLDLYWNKWNGCYTIDCYCSHLAVQKSPGFNSICSCWSGGCCSESQICIHRNWRNFAKECRSPKSMLGLHFGMVVQILTRQCCCSLILHKPGRAPSFLGDVQFLMWLLSRRVGRLTLKFISYHCFGIFGHCYGGKEAEKL